MSRSRRTRRGRRARPSPPAAPAAGSSAQSATGERAAFAAPPVAARPVVRSRRTTYPHIGGELMRVLTVSIASFGLLVLLIAVDRLR